MPKLPRFKSERIQQALVTTAMVLLLAFSLLLALAFTNTYRRTGLSYDSLTNATRLYGIGSMQIELPPHWRQVPSASPSIRTLGTSRQYINALRQDQQLHIAWLSMPRVTSPERLLAMFKQGLGLPPDQPALFTTVVRESQRTIVLTSLQSPGEGPADALLHHLAIFTDTGRQYGVAIFTQSFSERDLPRPGREFELEPLGLITNIAQQAVFRELEHASAAALLDAGLAPLPASPAKQWMLATTLDGGSHQAIHLLPTSGTPAFWTARVRTGPTLAFPADDASSPYAPANLLMQSVFAGDEKHPAPEADPSLIASGHHRIWRWRYPPSTSDPGLHRERWYVAPAQDTLASSSNVLVVDLLCQPQGLSQATRQLTQALTSLQPASKPAPAGNDHAHAIERGQAIARILNATLDQRIPHATEYGFFTLGRHTIGLMLIQSGPGANPQTIRGRSLLIKSHPPRFVYEQQWATTPQADQWWLTGRMSLQSIDASSPHLAGHDRLEFSNHTLRSLNLLDDEKSATPAWTHPTDGSFVSSIAMDYFPPASLQAWAGQPAAVLWTNLGIREAQPVFFEVQPSREADDIAPLRDIAPWRVILRPPAGIEPVVLWVDAQGRTVHSQWHMQEDIDVSSWPFAIRHASREEAIQSFKMLEADIQKWEKEWETP